MGNTSALTKKQKLEWLRSVATDNGGCLLSTEWKGMTAKYSFAFADGREFARSAVLTKTLGWPKNVDRYLFSQTKISDRDAIYLDRLKQVAIENSGLLLSTEWKGSTAKYLFQFHDGRTFSMSCGNLEQSGWPKNPDSYFRRSKPIYPRKINK